MNRTFGHPYNIPCTWQASTYPKESGCDGKGIKRVGSESRGPAWPHVSCVTLGGYLPSLGWFHCKVRNMISAPLGNLGRQCVTTGEALAWCGWAPTGADRLPSFLSLLPVPGTHWAGTMEPFEGPHRMEGAARCTTGALRGTLFSGTVPTSHRAAGGQQAACPAHVETV